MDSPLFAGESRLEAILHTPGEVRAAGKFSETEVRTILSAHPKHGLKGARDLRLLGCPEWLFIRMLEKRAAKIGLKVENRVAAPAFATDEDRRARAAEVAKLIAADKKSEQEEQELKEAKFRWSTI